MSATDTRALVCHLLPLIVVLSVAPRSSMAKESDEVYFQQGLAHLQQGELGLAAEALQQAITLEPKKDEPYFYLGKIYSARRQFEQAITAVERAVALDTDNATYPALLGTLYGATGQLDQAEQAYDKAMQLLKRPMKHGPDPDDVAFSIRKVQLLKSLVQDHAQGASAPSFAGAWAQRQAGIGRFEWPGHSPEETTAARQQAVAQLTSEVRRLDVTQHGHLLYATDPLGDYTGFMLDRWFVLGMVQRGRDGDCDVQQTLLLNGQLDHNQLRGSTLLEGVGTPSDKCPETTRTIEIRFTAQKQS